MNTIKLAFNKFSEVESELRHNCLYLVNFIDEDGSQQLMIMRWNAVGRQFYCTTKDIDRRTTTILLQGDMLDECSVSNYKYVKDYKY